MGPYFFHLATLILAKFTNSPNKSSPIIYRLTVINKHRKAKNIYTNISKLKNFAVNSYTLNLVN